MKSRVFGIGPQLGYLFEAAPGIQGAVSLIYDISQNPLWGFFARNAVSAQLGCNGRVRPEHEWVNMRNQIGSYAL